MICLSELLQLAQQPMADPSSSERQIMEGDIFQNYDGKDQCIYMYVMCKQVTYFVDMQNQVVVNVCDVPKFLSIVGIA